jgi:hypothetical protein
MEMAPIRQLIKCFSAHRTRLDGMIMLDVAHENPSPATFPSDLETTAQRSTCLKIPLDGAMIVVAGLQMARHQRPCSHCHPSLTRRSKTKVDWSSSAAVKLPRQLQRQRSQRHIHDQQ